MVHMRGRPAGPQPTSAEPPGPTGLHCRGLRHHQESPRQAYEQGLVFTVWCQGWRAGEQSFDFPGTAPVPLKGDTFLYVVEATKGHLLADRPTPWAPLPPAGALHCHLRARLFAFWVRRPGRNRGRLAGPQNTVLSPHPQPPYGPGRSREAHELPGNQSPWA